MLLWVLLQNQGCLKCGKRVCAAPMKTVPFLAISVPVKERESLCVCHKVCSLLMAMPFFSYIFKNEIKIYHEIHILKSVYFGGLQDTGSQSCAFITAMYVPNIFTPKNRNSLPTNSDTPFSPLPPAPGNTYLCGFAFSRHSPIL